MRMAKGDVYVERPDGFVAVNVQGMPVEVCVTYLQAVSDHLGEGAVIRNATKEVVNDGLLHGAWYVLGVVGKEGD